MARISIEDCVEKIPNRFALVIVAANRTRQLMAESPPLVSTKNNKHAVVALREISHGKIVQKGNIDFSIDAARVPSVLVNDDEY